MIKNKLGMSISSPFFSPLTQFSYFSDVAQLAYFFQMFGTTVPTIIVIKSTGKKINWMQEQLLYDRSLPSLHRLSQLRWKPKKAYMPDLCTDKCSFFFGGGLTSAGPFVGQSLEVRHTCSTKRVCGLFDWSNFSVYTYWLLYIYVFDIALHIEILCPFK